MCTFEVCEEDTCMFEWTMLESLKQLKHWGWFRCTNQILVDKRLQMGGKEGSRCLWGIKLRNEEVRAGECCHKRINYQSRFLVEKVMYQLPRPSTQNFTEDFTTNKFSCSRIQLVYSLACCTQNEQLTTEKNSWNFLQVISNGVNIEIYNLYYKRAY